MIVGRMAKHSHALLALLIVLVVSSLVLGMNVLSASESAPRETPAAEADSSPSVTCIPLGLYGDITTPVLVGRLSEGSDNLTFVGTSNGLYVVGPDGKLYHFLYSPFGIRHVALIDDITDDGMREVVVMLNDTQVPALRCYNGATWEKLWQFAPMAKIWDKLWVERQLSITGLGVIEDGDSQSMVVTSGRCLLSVDAEDGTAQWRFSASSALGRMVTLADLNSDGADEVFVGSDDGSLYLLRGKTGEAQWQTKLPEHEDVNYNDIEHLVSDIIVLDEEAGKVAVASADGWAQMYDLVEKRREWAARVFRMDEEEYQYPFELDCMLMSPTLDITGDGLAEVLLSKTRSDYQYSGAMTNGETALCDSAGNIVWDKGTSQKGATVWPGMAFETGVFEGKPVYLDRAEPQQIALVDVRDGESVLHTIPLDALDHAGVIMKQPGGDGYLAFSSESDLAAISATGELLWYYPRVANVKAVKGSFVGDGTEDVLLWGESGGESYPEPAVRLLRMMDGATGTTAWSYEMPYGELKSSGGLKGVQVTADLVGGVSIPDIIGYAGDTVFIFSGKDGSLTTFSAVQAIASLEVIRNGASGNAFAVSVASGLLIFDLTGTPLWTTITTDWIGDESGSFMVMDDINSDNVSDLAVFSSSRIVVLKSPGQASNYELHQTLPSESGFSIRLPEMAPDSDRDGVRELAYLQESALERQEYEGGHSHIPPRHLLCIQSLEDGQSLFKADLQGTVLSYDLACGDFNADGYPDSAMLVLELSEGDYEGNHCLRILSGKDGSLVWEHVSHVSGYGFSSSTGGIVFGRLPAANVGDMNGDGADDLACNVALSESSGFSGSYRQQRLQVFDVAHDTTLKDIAVTPRLHYSSFGDYYDTGSDEAMLQADFDADGHPEVIMRVVEPSIPSYDPDASSNYFGISSPQYLALVDMDSGRRLSTFAGFDTTTMSVFQSHQPGILEVAACGGVCFLRLGSDLQVTSPEDGAMTRPIVGVQWQGPTDGDFSQVFVDGVRNDITNSFQSELFLARGNHTIVVRSVDDYGRISYGPADLGTLVSIRVAPSPWKPVWLVLSLFAMLAVIVLLFYARLHRTWRARQGAAK